MTDADATVGTRTASANANETSSGALPGTRLDLIVIGVVVLSLFFERLDRSLYRTGTSVIPDLTFDMAIAILSLRYLNELVRRRVRLGRVTRREYVVVGFIAVVLVLGAASLLTLPTWMSSGSQLAKSSIHLSFLAYAAILIGRAVSRTLFEFAMKLYFLFASAAAAFAIVQAVDLNAGHSFLTRHLHLIFRPHPNGYKAPCSIFSEPAQLGYISVAALVIGVLMWRSIGLRRTIAGCILCVLALLLSFPAGATIVAVVLALILAIERRPKLSKRTWGGVAAIAAILAAVALASPVGSALYSRASGIVTGSDPSAQYRTAIDNASIRIWKIAPATGVGIGDSRKLLPSIFHFQTPYVTTPQKFNDSNAYLSLLAETGVIGVAASLVLLATFIWPETRPPRFATITQLNIVGIAVSFFVAGSFLLPTLWFWGGLRLASIRSTGAPDLFETSIASLWRRLIPERSGALPSSAKVRAVRILRLVLLAVIIIAVAATGYAFGVQKRTSSAEIPVTVNGVTQLSQTAKLGDAKLAHADLKIWGKCGRHCHASLHYIAGRLWRIEAKWASGDGCIILDLSSFRQTSTPAKGMTNGFTGLTPVSCG
jgi:O-Antigen ligase